MLFQESAHSCSAEVVEDAELGKLQQKDLETLVWQHGDLAVEFTKWMGMMHRITQTKFRDLLFYGKPGALCATLIRLSNLSGVVCEEGIRIDHKMTNGELAEMIGASRECVNRLLSEMSRAHVRSIDNGTIWIHVPVYLRDICHCEDCPSEICRM